MQLRNVEQGDKELIRSWRNLPEIAQYMYTDHQITTEEHEQWFNRIMNNPRYQYWVVVYDDAEIGLVNLYDIDSKNQRCFWAFYLASPNIRGLGLGSLIEYLVLRHVFEERNLNKLCCEVLDFNQPVVKLHKKFGFQEEGVYRQHVYKGDKFHEVIALAMLRSEWLANKEAIAKRVGRHFNLADYPPLIATDKLS